MKLKENTPWSKKRSGRHSHVDLEKDLEVLVLGSVGTRGHRTNPGTEMPETFDVVECDLSQILQRLGVAHTKQLGAVEAEMFYGMLYEHTMALISWP